MTERSHIHTHNGIQVTVSFTAVLDLEGEDAVYIRNLEPSGKFTVAVTLQRDAHVWVESNEFQLHIIGSER